MNHLNYSFAFNGNSEKRTKLLEKLKQKWHPTDLLAQNPLNSLLPEPDYPILIYSLSKAFIAYQRGI
ncbi:MAG: hypothetical protein OXR68_05475 [Alphaproteobacteria bacterium]|nr:hypothetical protein [Alphaproteobacteria bacterium]MDD9920054.1 hypothetical protein [Alphaproteobacteria bacterium]